MTQRPAREYQDFRGHPYEWAEAQIKLEGYTVGRVDYHRGRSNTYHNRGADVYVFVGANDLVKDVRWNLDKGPAAWAKGHYMLSGQMNTLAKGNHNAYLR